jgi:HEPN domain-containing protein
MADPYVEVLRRRSLGFLDNAKDSFQRGDYDLTLFHIEQFLQLYLKHLLYKKIGAYPKSHSLTLLFKEVQKVYANDALSEFYSKNLETVNLLEDVYITSRYLPREYDRELAERLLKFAEKALEVLKWPERR